MSQSDKRKDNSAKGLSRRDFLQTAGIATLAIGSGAMSLSPETAQAKQPPPKKTKSGRPLEPKRYNVLFILTDQERYL
ncbi:MAG: twin-arginine translocation signal domain-containing protein, partial [Syntrophobacterales bacterium]